MNATIQHSGNAIEEDVVIDLSSRIDIPALREYRKEVGRRTREIVKQLIPSDLKKKVEPGRLETVMEQGALLEEAVGIKEYWGRRDTAGLLLMPATRHNLVHLNEALQLKGKRN